MILSDRQPKESARDYAVRVVRDNIVAMVLEPGCMVSENELAAEMGLSRTPVREALIELSKTGIVEIFPQHGSMVSRIDYDKVEEASFVRRILETAIVEEVCDCIGESDLNGLDDNLSLQTLYLERGDADRLLAMDDEFHLRLFHIARKNLSYQLMRGLSAHFDRVRHLSLVVIKDIGIVQEHRRILDALRRRDRADARQAMLDHLTRYRLDKALIREHYGAFMVE